MRRCTQHKESNLDANDWQQLAAQGQKENMYDDNWNNERKAVTILLTLAEKCKRSLLHSPKLPQW